MVRDPSIVSPSLRNWCVHSRGSRGGHPLAALGSEDWCNPSHGARVGAAAARGGRGGAAHGEERGAGGGDGSRRPVTSVYPSLFSRTQDSRTHRSPLTGSHLKREPRGSTAANPFTLHKVESSVGRVIIPPLCTPSCTPIHNASRCTPPDSPDGRPGGDSQGAAAQPARRARLAPPAFHGLRQAGGGRRWPRRSRERKGDREAFQGRLAWRQETPLQLDRHPAVAARVRV